MGAARLLPVSFQRPTPSSRFDHRHGGPTSIETEGSPRPSAISALGFSESTNLSLAFCFVGVDPFAARSSAPFRQMQPRALQLPPSLTDTHTATGWHPSAASDLLQARVTRQHASALETRQICRPWPQAAWLTPPRASALLRRTFRPTSVIHSMLYRRDARHWCYREVCHHQLLLLLLVFSICSSSPHLHHDSTQPHHSALPRPGNAAKQLFVDASQHCESWQSVGQRSGDGVSILDISLARRGHCRATATTTRSIDTPQHGMPHHALIPS